MQGQSQGVRHRHADGIRYFLRGVDCQKVETALFSSQSVKQLVGISIEIIRILGEL